MGKIMMGQTQEMNVGPLNPSQVFYQLSILALVI